MTLFENVRVFDGSGPELTAPVNVLVRDRLIERISPETIEPEPGATVIDGAGGTLMPGLIDAHWHAMLVRPTPAESIHGDIGFNNLIAGAEATDTLMRGFTTVRDMGGPVFGLKQAIDAGVVAGPRIYPSGAMITVTGGHGDFRQLSELPRTLGAPSSRMEELGGSMVADSPDEVRVRAREQLMQGASQIKLTAGGGVASPHSPLDVSTFTEEELRAAVEAAGNWGTYVAVHAYTPETIRRAIAAGVKVIEHGHLMDDATARLMAEQDIWLSTQPFVDDEDAVQFPPGSDQAAQKQAVTAGTEFGLCPGEEVRDPDRLRHRHPLLAGARHPPGRLARPDGALVHPRRGAEDGDPRQRRAARADGVAQPLSGPPRRRRGGRARRPPAGRRRPDRRHRPPRRSGQPRRDHEGRPHLQEQSPRALRRSGPEGRMENRGASTTRQHSSCPSGEVRTSCPASSAERVHAGRKASMSNLTERLRDGAHALIEKAGDLQERIRQRARAIWEREGRPDGREHDHWRTAEEEIAAEDAAAAKPGAKPKRAKARTAEAKPAAPKRTKKPAAAAEAASAAAPAKTARSPGKTTASATKSASPAPAKPRRAAPKKDG